MNLLINAYIGNLTNLHLYTQSDAHTQAFHSIPNRTEKKNIKQKRNINSEVEYKTSP